GGGGSGRRRTGGAVGQEAGASARLGRQRCSAGSIAARTSMTWAGESSTWSASPLVTAASSASSGSLPPRSRQMVPMPASRPPRRQGRSEEHTSELQSRFDLVCRLLLEKKNRKKNKRKDKYG